MRFRWAAAALLATALLFPAARLPGQAAPAAAVEPPGEPVLHEYVPTPAEQQSLLRFAAQTGEGRLPPGFRQAGETLPRPDDDLAPQPGERRVTASDRRTERRPEMRPDRNTRHDGELRYHAVFNPSVVPFKRVNALDAVNRRFVLVRRHASERPVPLLRFSGSPDRTLFWGSVLLRARPGQRLPLPSVAPDMTIHGYETIPRWVSASFYRDGADNFSVSFSVPGRRAGPIRSRISVRLRFLVSAPNRYFSHGVPADLHLTDVPADLRPRVPANVLAVARRMHRRLGLDPSAPLAVLVDRLVAHFRAFEEGPLAVHLGTLYEDLTVSQRGVCRHRAYAFVITALALGIPARYVHNEAHAFVEIFVPRLGWVRIDLGGAADELNVRGGASRAVHQPLEDPFPKPPTYANNYSRLSGNVSGLSARQRRGPRPRVGHGALRQLDGAGPGTLSGGGPAAAAPATVRPEVSSVQSNGWRGAPVVIRGRVLRTQGGRPAAGLRVELLLRKPGDRSLILLGETTTRPDGSYHLRTTVPLSAPVGTYQVVAHCPAGDGHAAAWSHLPGAAP